MIASLYSIDIFADSEPNIFEFIVFLALLAFSFISWSISKIKAWLEQQKTEREHNPQSNLERRKIWESQVGQNSEPQETPSSTPPPLPSKAKRTKDIQELIEVFQQHQPHAQYLPPTPEIPTPAPHAKRISRPTQEIHSLKAPKAPYQKNLTKKKNIHPLTKLLRDPMRYKEAVILKEILDTPKALKDFSNPLD